MKYYIILFLGVLLTHSVHAQESDSLYEDSEEYSDEEYSDEESDEDDNSSINYPPVDPRQIWKKNGYDSERVELKKFDTEKWKEVVGKTDYREEEPEPEKSDESSKRNLSLNLPIPPIVLKIIFYALVFGVIGYLLFMILKNTSLKAKPDLKKKDSGDPIEQVADIKELEVDRLLQDALASGNYPLAIRICFLGLLKKLNEDGYIIWKKDKTNRDYLTELFHKQRYFEEVKSLTLAYEEVWYGDHHFAPQAYEKIISSFKDIDQKLNASKTSAE